MAGYLAETQELPNACSLQLLHQTHRSFIFLMPFHAVWISKTKKINLRYNKQTNTVAPEPEGSSPSSRKPVTGPYPEPSECTLHLQPISLKSIVIHPPNYAMLCYVDLKYVAKSSHFQKSVSKNVFLGLAASMFLEIPTFHKQRAPNIDAELCW
jgi:hypothetical protein